MDAYFGTGLKESDRVRLDVEKRKKKLTWVIKLKLKQFEVIRACSKSRKHQI